jgi:hypothetical protein
VEMQKRPKMSVDNNLLQDQYGAPRKNPWVRLKGAFPALNCESLGVEFPAKSRRQSMAIVPHAEALLSLADSVPCL